MATVQNHDILGLVRRIDRFVVELIRGASSNVSEVIPADLARLKAYLDALRKYKSWVIGQPLLDLPETHPLELLVPEAPVVPDIENESVTDVIVLLNRLRGELTASQSARYSSTMLAFDSSRFDAVVAKVEAFIKDYIEQATPLDLPESSPMAPLSK